MIPDFKDLYALAQRTTPLRLQISAMLENLDLQAFRPGPGGIVEARGDTLSGGLAPKF
jgi:hypothetical protein